MALTDVTFSDLLEGDIFELLGIAEADQANKEGLLASMLKIIDLRVANRVADLLGSEKSAEFKSIAEAGNPQELADFLVNQKIDLPQIVSEEATRYRVELVEMFKLATQP